MAYLQRDRYRLILAGTVVLLLSFSGACSAADENDSKGELLATFSANLKTAGRYEVRFSFTSNRNGASNVPVTVHHQNKDTVVMVNQNLVLTEQVSTSPNR